MSVREPEARETALLVAGWRKHDARWRPPADVHIRFKSRLSSANGYSLEDAFALNQLIEAAKRHLRRSQGDG